MYLEGDDFETREFRRAVWHRTVTPVALLTAAADGVENVMACEWAMMVSQTPMAFVISVHPSHVTHDLIVRSGEFGLSFCTDEQATLSHVSGSFSLHETDKWELADFPRYPAKTIGAPMIDGCMLNVECRVVGQHDLGHTVFIGQATWARYTPAGSPLLYHDGKYWKVGEQVAKP